MNSEPSKHCKSILRIDKDSLKDLQISDYYRLFEIMFILQLNDKNIIFLNNLCETLSNTAILNSISISNFDLNKSNIDLSSDDFNAICLNIHKLQNMGYRINNNAGMDVNDEQLLP